MKRSEQIIAAIKQKYGEEVAADPRKAVGEVDPEKMKKEMALMDEKERSTIRKEQLVEKNGYLISQKIFTKESSVERTCPVCNVFSFSPYDDVYMMRYRCCFECFVLHVEGREEKWKQKMLEEEKNG